MLKWNIFSCVKHRDAQWHFCCCFILKLYHAIQRYCCSPLTCNSSWASKLLAGALSFFPKVSLLNFWWKSVIEKEKKKILSIYTFNSDEYWNVNKYQWEINVCLCSVKHFFYSFEHLFRSCVLSSRIGKRISMSSPLYLHQRWHILIQKWSTLTKNVFMNQEF